MTRTPLSRSRSPGRFTHRGVNPSGSGERGNVLAVGTYCYVAVCTVQAQLAWRREALRRRHIVAAPRLQLVINSIRTCVRWTVKCTLSDGLCRRVGAGVVRVVFTTPIFFQPQFFARNKIKK